MRVRRLARDARDAVALLTYHYRRYFRDAEIGPWLYRGVRHPLEAWRNR